MKVFKACMIIIKRRSFAFSIYVGIFLALSIIMPMLSSQEYSIGFEGMKPNFTIINRDMDSTLSDGLTTYLQQHGNPVALEDNRDALQDATFFRASDYIAILPQGFNDAFWAGSPIDIESVSTPNSATGLYMDMLVNQYLNQVRVIATLGGVSEETAISSALDDLSSEAVVEVVRYGAGAPLDAVYQVYTRFLCYTILVLIILCTGVLTTSFRRPDLRMRNLCSPMRPQSMSGQQFLCGVLFSFGAWLLLTAVGFALYAPILAGVDRRIIGLILINSIAFTVVALSIASVISPFLTSPNSQNAASNFLSLGLCFLGGVFVPLELLGEGMLMVSRFTPAYWYVTAVDQISALTSFGSGALAPIWRAILTQLIFSAAFFCVALAIGKHLSSSERFFGRVKTELEA